MSEEKKYQMKYRCNTKNQIENYKLFNQMADFYREKDGISKTETFHKIFKDGLEANKEQIKEINSTSNESSDISDILGDLYAELDFALDKEINKNKTKYDNERDNNEQYLEDYIKLKYPNPPERNIFYLKIFQWHLFNELQFLQDFLYTQKESSFLFFLTKKEKLSEKEQKEIGNKIIRNFFKKWYDKISFLGVYNNRETININKLEVFIHNLYDNKRIRKAEKSYYDISETLEKDSETLDYEDLIDKITGLFLIYYPKEVDFDIMDKDNAPDNDNKIFNYENVKMLEIKISPILKSVLNLKEYSKYLNENYVLDKKNIPEKLITYFDSWIYKKKELNEFNNSVSHYIPSNIFSRIDRYLFNVYQQKQYLFSLFEEKTNLNINNFKYKEIDYLLKKIYNFIVSNNLRLYSNQMYSILLKSLKYKKEMNEYLSEEDFKNIETYISDFEKIIRNPVYIIIELLKEIENKNNVSEKEQYFIENLLNLLLLKRNDLKKYNTSDLFDMLITQFENRQIAKKSK